MSRSPSRPPAPAAPVPTAPDPATLYIVSHPDPVLHQKATYIPPADDATRAVASKMLELMVKAEGIGLAAPQVGLPWRMFVLNVPEDEEDGRLASSDPPQATTGPRLYINPSITAYHGPLESYEEGCLSLPDIRGDVYRPAGVTVTATGHDGQTFTHTAAGLLARCIQHELDHLDGVLIIDKMTQTGRMKNKKKLKELEGG
jgi:peptide deformylase